MQSQIPQASTDCVVADLWFGVWLYPGTFSIAWQLPHSVIEFVGQKDG